MVSRKYTAAEAVAKGEAIYAQRVRPLLAADSTGRFVVIDLESEDFEIADDDTTATEQIRARRPNAITYGVRVGYATPYRLGSRLVSNRS
jgi:hypothetical protein